MSVLKKWYHSGNVFVWLVSGAVTISIMIVFGLLILIAFRGMGYFWPRDVYEFKYKDRDGKIINIIGEIHHHERVTATRLKEAGLDPPEGATFIDRYCIKVGNREFGPDFKWVEEYNIENGKEGMKLPDKVLTIERLSWGNVYGYFVALKENDMIVAEGDPGYLELKRRLAIIKEKREQIDKIEKREVGSINYRLEKLRLQERKLELRKKKNEETMKPILEERKRLTELYDSLQDKVSQLKKDLEVDSIDVRLANGKIVNIKLANIVDAYMPNSFTLFDKVKFYIHKLYEFLTDDPREANTEGGIFPAIFGTCVMVIIMSIFVTPFGVIAAIYIREYAKQGPLVKLIRVAINNLAGVPSVVYGVFGLGFFVYLIGGTIDQLFFEEALPQPTLGTGGLLWSSVTLAILTLPVVIVSTEEGLARIPLSLREGSLALGATKFETTMRVVLPLATPAMITGLILAIARAAGEVAPLMLVGVVKLAPQLPVDTDPPFIHLDRKFMHLGFHIYDIGFQSPNVDATKPLVYATALILVVLIVMLNLTAIIIRNRLREKYKALGSI